VVDFNNIEQIVAISDGKIVGKIRLQKMFYLLQKSGLDTQYEFEYYHYGPYSSSLAEDAQLAEFLGTLNSDPKLGYHNVPYVVFTTDMPAPEKVVNVDRDTLTKKIHLMDSYSSVVLELAATLLFLQEDYSEAAEVELKIRKPSKATPQRIEAAKELLGKLELVS
jgi:uncharacterized protein